MIKNKVFFCILTILFPIVTAFVFFNTYGLQFENIGMFILLIICLIVSILATISRIVNKQVLFKLFFVINIICCLVLLIWIFFDKNDILDVFSSIESFKQFILSTKEKGMIIYVLIQFIQVLSVPIPSMIITLTGVAIYGPFLASILCSLGVLMGSYCSFFVGKLFGFKIVKWIVGEETAIKYANIIEKKGRFFLIIAFLLPLFPDDVLCLISGITTMKFKHFFWITLITRPIGVICMSYFGGGYIIPFTGWGLFVWPFILIIAVVAVVVLTKYQEKIESWILEKLNLLTSKKQKNR